MIDDAVIIGMVSKGMFSFENLKEMSKKSYDRLYKVSFDIVKKLYGKNEEVNQNA